MMRQCLHHIIFFSLVMSKKRKVSPIKVRPGFRSFIIDKRPISPLMVQQEDTTLERGLELGEKLIDICEEYQAACKKKETVYGLSFNQTIAALEESARIFVAHSSEESAYTIYINPKLDAYSNDIMISREGCLSMPGKMRNVKRYSWIDLSYMNTDGEMVVERIDGFYAFVIQQEVDHLNGILMTDKRRK